MATIQKGNPGRHRVPTSLLISTAFVLGLTAVGYVAAVEHPSAPPEWAAAVRLNAPMMQSDPQSDVTAGRFAAAGSPVDDRYNGADDRTDSARECKPGIQDACIFN